MLQHLTVPLSKLSAEVDPLIKEGWSLLSHSHSGTTHVGWEPRLSLILHKPDPIKVPEPKALKRTKV